jgi:hypothetical protein
VQVRCVVLDLFVVCATVCRHRMFWNCVLCNVFDVHGGYRAAVCVAVELLGLRFRTRPCAALRLCFRIDGCPQRVCPIGLLGTSRA